MLVCEDIVKKYIGRKVLNGASLSADTGCITGILGKNGSGKSTLLKIIAGVIPANHGSVCWDDKDILRNSALRRSLISYVPQGMPLYPELNGMDNARLFSGLSKDEIRSLCGSGLFNVLGVSELLPLKVSKMSGGMRKRLIIASLTAGGKQIMLLDEPLAALDLSARERIRDFLRIYCESGGTVITATHDPEEIETCSATWILEEGKLTRENFSGRIGELARRMEA